MEKNPTGPPTNSKEGPAGDRSVQEVEAKVCNLERI